MPHFVIFYNIIILFILLVSFNIPVIIFIKTGDKFLRNYIFFFLPFILFTISLMSITYLNTNINDVNNHLIQLIFYFSEITFVLMILSVGLFGQYLFSVSNIKIKNLILIIIAIIEILLIPFHVKTIIINERFIFKIGSISSITFIIIIIYILFVGILNYKKIKNIEIKNIAKSLLIINLLFFPGLMFDLYRKLINISHEIIFKNRHAIFLIHPIFYSVLSIICTYFIIRYYFNLYKVNIKDMPLDNLIKKYDISIREKEVVSLVIQGKSNKDIADNLFISVNTVKTHIRNIYEKIGIKSRYELINSIKDVS